MPIKMPSLPESLTYALLAALALAVLVALGLLGSGNPVAAVLVFAAAAGVRWMVARYPAAIVRAEDAIGAAGLLFVVCAVAALVSGHPYAAVFLLLTAAALGFAYLMLHQETVPADIPFGGVLTVGSSRGESHRRMLEELHDAGILSDDEFAAKRVLVGL